MTPNTRTHTTRQRNTRRRWLPHSPFQIRNDDGSLLLVILFTLMMTALILVVTATMLAGLNKTRNSRDYATALQASDTAFADALMEANLGKFPTSPSVTTYSSGQPQTLGTVTWTWTATRVSGSTKAWTIAVEAKGATMTRHFTATLKGTQVNGAVVSNSTGAIRYTVDKTENYQYGFFGQNGFTVATTSPASVPDFDGYNGEVGTVGSDGNLALGSATMDRISLWSWTTDSSRCTGTYCPVANGGSGYADVNRIPQSSTFSTSDITNACATTYGAWTSSTNGTNPLVAGRCYDSLTFDNNAPIITTGVVYVKSGGVTVNSGVTVNTTGSNANVASSKIRIATLGNFVQNANSKIAMAVYAPNGSCNVNANVAVPTSPANQTLWLGAATCKTFTVTGSARFRYDGGLALVNDSVSGVTSGKWVYSLFDYQSVD